MNLKKSPEINRRGVLKLGGAFASAAAISAALAACSGGPSSTVAVTSNSGGDASSSGGASGTYSGPSGDITAVVGYGSNQSWDPFETASAFCMAANRHIYEGLVTFDLSTGEASPALAKALPTEKAATSWTFELRDGAKFHDGSDVTIDDVVFSFDRALKPTGAKADDGSEKFVYINTFFRAWLKEAVKVDDTTVQLNLNYPFDLGLARLEMIKIVSKSAFDGKWAELATGAPLLPMGTGPYKVTANVPGTSTTFAANADYTGPFKPNFNTMQWQSITDATARVNKLVSGEAVASDNVPAANIETLKAAGKTVETGSGAGCAFLMFNTAAKPFDDPRARQALFHAIDYDKLISVALRGTGQVPKSALPDFLGFAAATNAFAYDAAKAKSLLAEAGVPAGQKVELLSVNVTWVQDCLPVIQEGWKAAGLDVTLSPMDTAALFKKMDQNAGYQIALGAGNPQQFGTDPDLLLRNYYAKGGLWMKYTKWDASEPAGALFTAMDTAAQETDAAKQKEQLQAILNTMSEEVVLYPVVWANNITGWDPTRLTGIKALPIPGLDMNPAKNA
ncbi:ABC transporter substrate-binding protein [Micrococcales bacterium 31B]|nr:ABC transporter substrate-binding protein [Micrococcales bacterium 31B]